MTVDEMLDRMTAEEYLDWQAFLHAERERQKHEAEKARQGLS